jgi:hypothetical protein
MKKQQKNSQPSANQGIGILLNNRKKDSLLRQNVKSLSKKEYFLVLE